MEHIYGKTLKLCLFKDIPGMKEYYSDPEKAILDFSSKTNQKIDNLEYEELLNKDGNIIGLLTETFSPIIHYDQLNEIKKEVTNVVYNKLIKQLNPKEYMIFTFGSSTDRKRWVPEISDSDITVTVDDNI